MNKRNDDSDKRGSNDPYHLQRFVDAQASCFAQVRSELAAGQKHSHWMWFIFPQITAWVQVLWRSALPSPVVDEADGYLIHPVLGARLRDCTALVNAVKGRSIGDIFGYPDDLKFHSSVTLFAGVGAHGPPFQRLGNHVFTDALAKIF